MKLVSTLALAHFGAASIHNMENMAMFLKHWDKMHYFFKFGWEGDTSKGDFWNIDFWKIEFWRAIFIEIFYSVTLSRLRGITGGAARGFMGDEDYDDDDNDETSQTW